MLRSPRAAAHTLPCRTRHTALRTLRFALRAGVGALALVTLHGAPLLAEPSPLEARVVWTRGDRVYVALEDSLALASGDRLTLRNGRRDVATAEVEGVLDGTIAVARIRTGTLDGVKKIASLRLLAERPPIPRLGSMRVGAPAGARGHLLVTCGRGAVRAPVVGYRVDSLDARTFRLLRDPAPATSEPPWPDTLLTRFFDDAADEEIALERGELDVALFWPGELSAPMRRDPRWRGFLYGTRAEGALAILPPPPGMAADSASGADSALAPPELVALDEELFRGDLGIRALRGHPAPAGAATRAAARYEVDHAIPGWERIERFLRERGPTAPGAPRHRIVAGPEVHAVAAQFRAPIRLAVVFDPAAAPHVRALGPDALARLFECAPGPARR